MNDSRNRLDDARAADVTMTPARAAHSPMRRRLLFTGGASAGLLVMAGCADPTNEVSAGATPGPAAGATADTGATGAAAISKPAGSTSAATAANAPVVDDVPVEPKNTPTMDIMNRPVNYTGSGSQISEAAPARYNDTTRPAPASMAHAVIYNTTTQRHQVSTGTKWMNLPSNAPLEAVSTVTLAARPRAASMPGEYVFVSDLSGGTYQRSNGSGWITVGRDYISVIESLLGVLIAGKPLADVTAGYTAARTVYVDPTAAAGGAGTLSSPRNSLSGVSLAAGTEVLIRQGSTLRGAVLVQNVAASQGAPLVIGVYDPANGNRVSALGAATVDAGGAAIGIRVMDSTWVCVDGLKVVGASGEAGLRVDRGANVLVKNCVADAMPQRGMIFYESTALTVDGCQANSNARDGISVEANTAPMTGLKLYRCVANSNGEHGIRWAPYSGTAVLTGAEIGGNTARFHVAGTDGNSGYGFRGSNMKDTLIYRNNFSDNRYVGLGLQAWTPHPDDTWSNVKLVSNDVSRNAMGIHFNRVQAPKMGDVTIEHNRCSENGSRDGGRTASDPTRYGRGIELFSSDPALRCENIVVRYNSCCRQTVWDEWMTEGLGIGLDDNTGWTNVYFNLCAENEGQGIQNNTNFAIRRFGNIMIDNNKLAQGARFINPNDTWLGELRSQMYRSGLDNYGLDFLNVLVGGNGFYQKFAIGDHVNNTDTQPRNGRLHNNVIINAAGAGLAKADGTEVVSNRFVNTPTPVRNAYTDGTIATGAGDSVTSNATAKTAAAQFAAASRTVLLWVPHYSLL
jgi:hypothetical protein